MQIGQVIKPQGIRGEVKIRPLTDDPTRFRALKTANVGGKPLRIESVRVNTDVYIKFVGIDDRNAAEELRNAFVEIDRGAAVALDDGEFFIADVTGSKLFARSGEGDATEYVGVITRVDSFGAADVFSVKSDEKNMSFAFVKKLNPVFDENDRSLTVDRAALDEVAVYED